MLVVGLVSMAKTMRRFHLHVVGWDNDERAGNGIH
jgi:hypothetical protein